MTAVVSIRSVQIQNEQAKQLLRALAISADEDPELVHDMVEGETGLFEVFDRVVARVRELEAYEKAIGEEVATLKKRAERFKEQAETLRASMSNAMQEIGLKKCERATFTASIAKGRAGCEIVSEADLPVRFLVEKTEVKPDKKAILEALVAGQDVPGAVLKNGAPSLSIRKV